MKQPEGITTLLNKATELLPEGIDSLREGVANNLQGIVEQKVKEAGFVSRKEFEELPCIAWLVSPKKHITHHIERTKHYSAPLIDFDEFLEKETVENVKNE